MPLSPSMKVILDSQLPVAVKPGSKVKYPALPYRLRISITEGPTVPSRIDSVVRCPVRLSISVTVSAGGSPEELGDGFSWLVICLSDSHRHELSCGDQAARHLSMCRVTSSISSIPSTVFRTPRSW